MKRARRVIVRACSCLAGHSGAWIVGLAVVSMVSQPRPAWGQSTWPSYPNNSAISVTSGGNVGIGTTSPVAPLHISKSGVAGTPTSYIQLQQSGFGDNVGVRIGVSGYNGGTQTAIDFIQNSATTWQSQIAFSTYTGAALVEAMRINPFGNVGIGTTSPGSYKLAVEGNIGARDIIVTGVPWSDYVFHAGYQLRPLRDLGAYIQANHHLPDIPSEAEVKAKGVSVGEMQAKLLAKIEELTLHMIRERERNDRLEQMVQELQKENQEFRESAGGSR